jgi:hypothetical protein
MRNFVCRHCPPNGSAIMTIEVDRPGIKVCPTLYGIFFEEVNHAGDGGLHAEMIRNRSFEDTTSRIIGLWFHAAAARKDF